MCTGIANRPAGREASLFFSIHCILQKRRRAAASKLHFCRDDGGTQAGVVQSRSGLGSRSGESVCVECELCFFFLMVMSRLLEKHSSNSGEHSTIIAGADSVRSPTRSLGVER